MILAWPWYIYHPSCYGQIELIWADREFPISTPSLRSQGSREARGSCTPNATVTSLDLDEVERGGSTVCHPCLPTGREDAPLLPPAQGQHWASKEVEWERLEASGDLGRGEMLLKI